MSPLQWSILPLQKYATFKGRSRRREFWWFMLLSCVVSNVAAGITGMVGMVLGVTAGTAQAMHGLEIIGVTLAFVLPTFAALVRRLHDAGKHGLWTLLLVVPFGFIPLIVWCCKDSRPGANKYGPNPKDVLVDKPAETRVALSLA